MLNLENLENRPFYGKSGKTWNSQGNLYNSYPSQETVWENRLLSLHAMFMSYGCAVSDCFICCR